MRSGIRGIIRDRCLFSVGIPNKLNGVMKKYFKEHFFQFLYLIPVCFIAVGSFILNIYLNQYGIIDVALFDSKTVFVGFIAVFQFIFFFLLIYIYIGKEKYKDELEAVFFMAIDVFLKPFLFSMLVYASSGCSGNLRNIYSDWKYDLTRTSALVSIVMFLVILSRRNYILQWESNTKKEKAFFSVVIVVEFLSTYLAHMYLIRDKVFAEIFEMYLWSSVAFSLFSIFILYGENPFKSKVPLFRKNVKLIKFDNFLAGFGIIIIFMITLINYSTKVYPYISSNLGGGYYKFNTLILTSGKKITGKIIHSNSKYIYIIKEENKLSQYFIDEIKTYEINEIVDSKKKIPDEPECEPVEDELVLQIIGSEKEEK